LDLDAWMGFYDEICREFGYDKEEDLQSARLLAGMVAGRSEDTLEQVKRSFPRSVVICGGAPSLQDGLSSMTSKGFVVAADSATSVLVESGIIPGMIVTDLDGLVEDQIELNAKGSVVFLHAHGDNQPALRRHADEFKGPVVGTCQCPPPPSLFNFGGFTDGDRAACICVALGASELALVGFDFDVPSEKPGRLKDVKKRKLQWAKRIIDHLAGEGVKIEML
jgi:uncharacterized Rossmann fold enzyme